MRSVLTVLITLFLLPSAVIAHHGKEFLLTASPRTPHQGEWFGILSSEFEKSSRHLGLEPGVLYGITGSWSSELHLHVGEMSKHPTLESIGAEQRFYLWGSRKETNEAASRLPIEIGALIEFETALSDETQDRVEVRGLFFSGNESFGVAVNLIAVQPLGANLQNYLAYGCGIKRAFGSVVSLSLELNGNVRKISESIVTPGVYVTLGEEFQLRFGSSFELSPSQSTSSYRLSMLMAF